MIATVIEDEEKGVLLINGQECDGFVDEVPCKKCSALRIYSTLYDAYFCAQCNEWIEVACTDPNCESVRNGLLPQFRSLRRIANYDRFRY